jgi:hypothetical protein
MRLPIPPYRGVMAKPDRLRVEYSVGEIVRPAVTEHELEVTRAYIQNRFGVSVDEKVAEGIVYSVTRPEPHTLTFTALDGTQCTIDAADLRPLLR